MASLIRSSAAMVDKDMGETLSRAPISPVQQDMRKLQTWQQRFMGIILVSCVNERRW
jgi:hypothetical protein